MRGYNETGKPFLDLEELGLLVFRNFKAFQNQVFLSAAKAHSGFLTAKIGQQNTMLKQDGYELMAFYRLVIGNSSHPLHATVKALDVSTACEYLKYIGPVRYIGTSCSVRNTPDGNYVDKAHRDKVIDRPIAKHFTWLDEEVASWNLFEDYGRIILFQNEHHSYTPIHRDWDKQDEFVWIGLSNKKFFTFDAATQTKHFFTGRAITFNNADYHGGDPSPSISLSLRIDGIFKPHVRERLSEACSS